MLLLGFMALARLPFIESLRYRQPSGINGTEVISDPIEVVNPDYRQLDGEVRSVTGKLTRRLAGFGEMTLDDTMEPKHVEPFVRKKAALQEEIERLQGLSEVSAEIRFSVDSRRSGCLNISKAILFILPTNVAQALVIAAAIFVGFTLPITAPQVLRVKMVTSVALGLVIAFEPHERDVMRRSPRAVDRPILTGFGIWRVVFVGLVLLGYTLAASSGWSGKAPQMSWRAPSP
nr:cation transporting ATPase C-terminal domain-containing protein [Thiorhodovibrio winogradskyi]